MYKPAEIVEILYSEEELQARVRELGKQLTEDFGDKRPLFVCVLKGSVVFFTDLIRAVECPLDIDFIRASSYYKGTVSDEVSLEQTKAPIDINGRHVVVVEDVLDTAKTLDKIKTEMLSKHSPASVSIVVLLDKPDRRQIKGFTADYIGFTIPDKFVVGYGIDHAENFRNLPYVGVAALGE